MPHTAAPRQWQPELIQFILFVYSYPPPVCFYKPDCEWRVFNWCSTWNPYSVWNNNTLTRMSARLSAEYSIYCTDYFHFIICPLVTDVALDVAVKTTKYSQQSSACLCTRARARAKKSNKMWLWREFNGGRRNRGETKKANKNNNTLHLFIFYRVEYVQSMCDWACVRIIQWQLVLHTLSSACARARVLIMSIGWVIYYSIRCI